jgi:hypothetical protein
LSRSPSSPCASTARSTSRRRCGAQFPRQAREGVRGSGRSRHQPRSPSYSDAIGALPVSFNSSNRLFLQFRGHRYHTLENIEGYLALCSLQRHYYASAPASSLNHFAPRSRPSAPHLSAPCTQLQSPRLVLSASTPLLVPNSDCARVVAVLLDHPHTSISPRPPPAFIAS